MFENIAASTEQYLTLIGEIPLHYLALALFTYYISVVLYAIRWKLVLRGMGKEVPLFELVKAILASIFMNNITPMSRSGGELLRITWISRRSKVPVGISTVSIIYERILETVPVFVLFLIGMLYFSAMPDVLFLIGIAGVAAIWIKWDSFVSLSLKIFKTSVSEEEMKKILSLRDRHNITLAGILLSSAVWILDVARLKLITLAFGFDLSLSLIAVISIANLLLGLVAFTPGGIGIIEGGLVGTLTHFGIPVGFAVSITLLERFVSYVLSSLVGFIVLLTSGGREVWKALKSQ
ncbi:flippase-like domain-containing protein [Thermococcus sp. LS1]|uniref:lysylphosphatidylglycerol synthase transmembrane domain-containing protein n=1 Tax=Thermococcus sp. LS1 TaxID=1638259 RepID=UPI00143B323E|nr:lysylphosphatidylglycerol synthase transmembrane domain-containing protein [Thermococcus sp. LS1]NJD99237.1 flippase-like domain-containing protein [Thermococcus sp. LS1]